MRYIGAYTNRKQVQRRVTLSRIIRTAAKIESADVMKRLLLVTRQMQHIDNGNASRAERLRDTINAWTVCHDGTEELKEMLDLICLVATRKARHAQRAAQEVI